jgi:hypothetical protein
MRNRGPRLSKRARKLAEALAAKRDLPSAEVERMAAAQDQFERKQMREMARLKKGLNAAHIPAAKSRTRAARRPMIKPPSDH